MNIINILMLLFGVAALPMSYSFKGFYAVMYTSYCHNAVGIQQDSIQTEASILYLKTA